MILTKVMFIMIIFYYFEYIQAKKNAVIVVMVTPLSLDLLGAAKYLKSLHKNAISGDIIGKLYERQEEPFSYTLSTGLHPNVHGVVMNHFHSHTHKALTHDMEQFYKHIQTNPIWCDNGERCYCDNWHGSQFYYGGQRCVQATEVNLYKFGHENYVLLILFSIYRFMVIKA